MVSPGLKQTSDCTDMLSLHQLAEALGNAVDARDQDTHRHSWDVAEIAKLLVTALGADASLVDKVHLAGHLHDIGKIGIPDAILKKTGRLDDQEWLMMRQHPVIGEAIIRPVAILSGPDGVAEMIRHHHERFDGQGYPDRLHGTAIPLGARIIAVADTLSALLQHRPYRPGTSFSEAVEEIVCCSGSQFDPDITKLLVEQQCNLKRMFESIDASRTQDYFISNRLRAIISIPPISPSRLS